MSTSFSSNSRQFINILVDFELNKNDGKREKTITQEKHPGRVTQSHQLAALTKKRKEEILHNKEQSTEQPSVQSTEQSSARSSVQPTVQSNDNVHGVGILAVLAIGVCVCVFYI